jgi:hypothetical protein
MKEILQPEHMLLSIEIRLQGISTAVYMAANNIVTVEPHA